MVLAFLILDRAARTSLLNHLADFGERGFLAQAVMDAVIIASIRKSTADVKSGWEVIFSGKGQEVISLRKDSSQSLVFSSLKRKLHEGSLRG